METGQSIESAEKLLESLQSLPVGVHLAAVVGLIAGLSLWFAGRTIVKPVFLLLGVLLCAVGGFFAAPTSGMETIYGYPSPYIGAGLGALLGLAAGAFVFRFTMAIASGASVAVAACLGAAIYLDANPTEGGADDPVPESRALAEEDLALNNIPIRESIQEELGNRAVNALDQGEEDTPESQMSQVAHTAAIRVQEFLGHLGAELGLIWSQMPVRDRSVISMAGLAGAFFGALLGLAMPVRASAIFTALFGAAIWMPCIFWLLTAFDVPIGFLGSMSAKNWLITWGVVSFLGVSAQWSGLAKRKMRSKSSDDDDDND